MEHTAETAAAYLAAAGYTAGPRSGGRQAHPPPNTIRYWCRVGRIKARRAGYIWLIDQAELDRLVAEKV